MGRPPKDEMSLRSEQLRLRLTKVEHAWIKTVAKARHCSMQKVLWDAFRKDVWNIPVDEIAGFAVDIVKELKQK